MGTVATEQAARPPRRRRLRDWRVRSRLIALVAVPTVVAVALGVTGLVGALVDANDSGRAATLARLADTVTSTAVALDDEQDVTTAFVAGGRAPATNPAVAAAQQRTDRATAALRAGAAGVDDRYPASTRARVSRAVFRLDALPALRAAATTSQLPAGVVVTQYQAVGTDLIAVDDEIAQDVADPQLSTSVRALGALSRARAELAVERALVRGSLIAGRFEPGGEQALIDADAARTGYVAQFRTAADQTQAQLYDDVVAGAPVDDTAARIGGLIRTGGPAVPTGGSAAADAWDAAASGALARLHTVESALVGGITDRAVAVRSSQITQAVVAGVIALAVLLIALLATVLVVRSLTGPLRALRRGATEVADERLPAVVGRLSREDPDGVDTRVAPIGVDAGHAFGADEIGDVARSFDDVHAEAVRLAAAEARRRAQARALVVNLSRRTQSLVERQLEMIDDLERTEEDPDRLGELFRLDHLATRMRRNGENLLVLGGEEPLRRWNRVMALLDVLRAAISEVEQYTRVELAAVPEIWVGEDTVSDLVHLLAELIENATTFSARSAAVTVETTVMPDETVLLEITDQGIGLAADEYERLNERLAAGGDEALGSEVSRRMGLVVVARLAARRGVTVRLRPGSVGVVARVSLPATVLAEPVTTPFPAISTSGGAGRSGNGSGAGTGGVPDGVPDGDGSASWLGERWSRAVAEPGPGADSWFGGAPLGGGADERDGFTPAAAGVTASGLPLRAPGANQVSGAGPDGGAPDGGAPDAGAPDAGAPDVSAPDGAAPSWDRGPSAIRDRYAGLQRGRARGLGESSRAGDVAEPARSPAAAGTTASGLPLRDPGANYVPGAADDPDTGPVIIPITRPAAAGAEADPEVSDTATWDRSAEAIRRRFAAHQQGRRRAEEARRS